MPTHAFTLAEGQAYNQAQTFAVRSVIVDNLTASWLFVQDAVRPVPPFQYGVVLPLPTANPAPRIYWQTPAGLFAPTPGSGTAYITMVDGELPPSNGQPVITPSQQVFCTLQVQAGGTQISPTAVQLGPTGASPGTAFILVNVPAGANSVTIVGQMPGSVTSVQLQGMTTLTQYMSVTTGNNPAGLIEPPLFAIIEVGADTQLALQIPMAAHGGTDIISVVANFGSQVVAIENGGTPVQVGPPGSAAGIVTQTTDGNAFTSISGTNTSQTITLTGSAPTRYVRLSQLVVTWSGATAGAPNVSISPDSGIGTLWEAIIPSGPTTNPTTFPGGIFLFPIPLVSKSGSGGLIITVGASNTAGIASVCSGVWSPF